MADYKERDRFRYEDTSFFPKAEINSNFKRYVTLAIVAKNDILKKTKKKKTKQKSKTNTKKTLKIAGNNW